jgi:hypothetical protein
VFQFMTEIGNSFFLQISVTAPGTTQTSFQWIRLPEHNETKHLPVTNTDVKHVLIGTSTSPYAFIPCTLLFYCIGIWFCTVLYVSRL